MKELTTEEKAQRYDEALKIAKDNYDMVIQCDKECSFARDAVVNTFHHMFPELKESEDEKIRRKLIILIEWSKSYAASGITTDEAKEMLAWLKKQREQKTPNMDRIKEKAHQIAWEYSKSYDPTLSKESWCEMAAFEMAYWLEKQHV